MFADWSAECAADDPVLVVPWQDPSGASAFVDLLANPYAFEAVPEAERYPPLMNALRALNAPRSPVFTAKCDAWPLGAEELEHLQFELDLLADEASAGFGSYIDLVWRARAIFGSYPRHEQALRKLTRSAADLTFPTAALECVLRPAIVDFEGKSHQGYAVSLYLKVAALDADAAIQEWGNALEAIVTLFRRRQ